MQEQLKKCPKCGSAKIIGVEYSPLSNEHADGSSEWQCKDCSYRQGRWTHQELTEGYIESRHGSRGIVKIKEMQV